MSTLINELSPSTYVNLLSDSGLSIEQIIFATGLSQKEIQCL